MNFKRIFHIRNEYTKNHLGFKQSKRKIIYFFGFKVTLKCKIRAEIKNEERLNWLTQKVTLLDKIYEEHKQHYVYSKELYWNCIAQRLTPNSGETYIANKCLLFKYDNFWEIGKYCGPNLGDNIQTLAVKRLLDKFYPTMTYEFVDRDCLTNYMGGGM